MVRILRQPRWIALLLAALLAVPACVSLALWQLDRLHERQADNDRITGNSSAPPRPIAALAPLGARVPDEQEWRAVSASGRYDTDRQLLVRNRSLDGPGFYVLTPLVTDGDTAVLVNRGWVPMPRRSGQEPAPPPPPGGTVALTGRWRPSEHSTGRAPAATTPADTTPADGTQRTVTRIDVDRIAATMPYRLRPGYVDLVDQDPPTRGALAAGEVRTTAPPAGRQLIHRLDVHTGSTALHAAYACQWFVFAALAPLGAIMLIRREAEDQRRRGARPAASVPGRLPRERDTSPTG